MISWGSEEDDVPVAVGEHEDEFTDRVLRAIPNALLVRDAYGRIVVWNAAAERLLGWRAPDALGRTFDELQLEPLEAAASEVATTGAVERAVLVRRDSGDFVSVLLHVSILIGEGPHDSGVVYALADLTAHAQTERDLRASQRQLDAMLQYSADILATLDEAGTITFVNDRVTQLTNYEVMGLVGRDAFDLIHPEDEAATRATLAEVASGASATGNLTLRIRAKNGDYVWMEGRAVNLGQQAGERSILLSLHDVTERVAQTSQLAHEATHDALTGLPNRVLFSDRLEHHLEHARRHGLLLALVYWDIDGFKSVNDAAGHAVGDELLVEMAQRAARVLRAEDSIARLGGDEFVACAELTDEPQVYALAERLVDALSVDLTLAHRDRVHVTASVGVAFSDSAPADELLREADRAMYDAKQGGGGAVTELCLPATARVPLARESRDTAVDGLDESA